MGSGASRPPSTQSRPASVPKSTEPLNKPTAKTEDNISSKDDRPLNQGGAGNVRDEPNVLKKEPPKVGTKPSNTTTKTETQAVSSPPAAEEPAPESAPVEPKKPTTEKAESKDVLARCISFLQTASTTGGKAVRCNPGDTAAFDSNSDKRRQLRPEFVKSLDQLSGTKVDFTDDASLASLLTVCKMSDVTDTEIADELVERKFAELFQEIWKAVYKEDIYTCKERRREYTVLNLLKQVTISFTHVSWKLCAEMGSEKYGIVSLMAKEFEHPLMNINALKDGVKKALWDSPRETLKKTVNVLANVIRGNIDSKPVFRQANIVPHLQELLKCRFLIMRAKALFCLVYLINEDENEALNTTDDNIEFVIKVLGKCLDETGHYSEHYTFLASVVVDGIVYLAENDSNKVKLVKKNVIPKLIAMMETESVAEKRAAATAVWKLAFHDDNKEIFKKNDKLIKVVSDMLGKETDPKLVKACETLLWMLDVTIDKGEANGAPTAKKRPKTAKKSDDTKGGTSVNETGDKEQENDEAGSLDEDDFDDELPHVMISYQWGVQKQMIRVKELLKAAGYNVWMDVDDMGGSTLEAMAAAVEMSAVVLVCFTEKYKRSASCRTEAEYTYKLQKSIVPLRLQQDYDPDGWLGIMIGTKLYVDLSSPETLETDITKLTQQLGERGRVLRDGATNASKPHASMKNSGPQKTAPTPQFGTGTRRNNKQASTQDHVDAKTVSTWTNDQVTAWLSKHGLGDLKNRFQGYSGQGLLGLKTVASEAPEFFYAELRKDFGFKNLLEIVTFKQALDEII